MTGTVRRRWALARLIVSGVLHGKFGPAFGWRMWRDADWDQP